MDTSNEDASQSLSLCLENYSSNDEEISKYPMIDFLILLTQHPDLQPQLETFKIILDSHSMLVIIDRTNGIVHVDPSQVSLSDQIAKLAKCITPIFEGTNFLEVKGFKSNREIQRRLREKSSIIITGDSLMDTINTLETLKDFQIRGSLKNFTSSYLVSANQLDNVKRFQSELETIFVKFRCTDTFYDNLNQKSRPSNEYAQELVEGILKEFEPNYLIVYPQIEFSQKDKTWGIEFKAVTFINRLFLKRFGARIAELSKLSKNPNCKSSESPKKKFIPTSTAVAKPIFEYNKKNKAASFDIKLNYCQYKYFKSYLGIKLLQTPTFNNAGFDFCCEKIQKFCNVEDLTNFKFPFGIIRFNGDIKCVEAAHEVINREIQNMRTRRYTFPYKISFRSMLELAVNKEEKFLTTKVLAILNKYSFEKRQIQISKFFVDSSDIKNNEVVFLIIYDINLSTSTIRAIDKELESLFDQIEEIIISINYFDLCSIMNRQGIDLDNYFDNRDAMFIKRANFDFEVIIAGHRAEIQEFKKKLPVDLPVSNKQRGPARKFIYVTDEISSLSERESNVQKPTISQKEKEEVLMKFEKKHPYETTKPSPKAVSTNEIIQHQQEFTKKQWDGFKAVGAEKFMKTHSLTFKEITAPKLQAPTDKVQIQWQWDSPMGWTSFPKEFNEIIEEGFVDEQEVLLDPAIVESGETMIFDFAKADIKNKLSGKSGTLIFIKEKNEIFFAPKGQTNIERVSTELTSMIIKKKEETNTDIIKVFDEDFVVMHSEKTLKHLKSKLEFEIRRVEVSSSQPQGEEKVLIQLTGTRENMSKFLLDNLRIQMPGLNALSPDRHISSDIDLNISAEINHPNTSFLSENDNKQGPSDLKSIVDMLNPKEKPAEEVNLLELLLNDCLDTSPKKPIIGKKRLKMSSEVFNVPYSKPEMKVTPNTLSKQHEKILRKAEDLDVQVKLSDNGLNFTGPGDYKELINFIHQLEKEEFILQNFTNLSEVILQEQNNNEYQSEDEQFQIIKSKIDEAFSPTDPQNFEIKKVTNRILFETWIEKCIKDQENNLTAKELKEMILDPEQNIHLVYASSERNFPIGVNCDGPAGNQTFVFANEKEDEINLLSDFDVNQGNTATTTQSQEINLLD